MATIIFCVHPIAGSVNASLKIARDLQSDGHNITYFGVRDCEKFVSPNHFAFVALFEQWFPKGYFEIDEQLKGLSFLEKMQLARQFTQQMKYFINALMTGQDAEFFHAVKTLNPALIITVATHYDSFIWALLAHKSGINNIYLHDTLCNTQVSGLPPITSNIIPNNSVFAKIKISLAWQHFLTERFLIEGAYSLLGIALNPCYGVKKLVQHYHYPLDCITTASDMLAPKLKLPELVSCPPDFEFTNTPAQVGRYYIGANIDLNRQQSAFTWEKIDNKPLIYCALGSLNCLNVQARINFYQIVIDTASLYREWQWVIALGEQLIAEQFNNISSNVILVNNAPQLALLKIAKLMINHGGTNTVKECILLGVPMLSFPVGFDTSGNTARIVHHGLGLRGDIKKLTVEKLRGLIKQITQTSYYRLQMQLMQQKFLTMEHANVGVNLINTIIDGNLSATAS